MEIWVFGGILLYKGSDGENRFSVKGLICLFVFFCFVFGGGGSFTCEDDEEELSRSLKCNSAAHKYLYI